MASTDLERRAGLEPFRGASGGLAPREFVVCRVGEMLLALDVLDVQEIRRFTTRTPVHRCPAFLRGLVNMRGQVVSLIDTGRRLGLEPIDLERPHYAVVVEHEGEFLALLVDEVEVIVEVTADEILPPPAHLSGEDARFFSAVVRTRDVLIPVLARAAIAGLDPLAVGERLA